MAEAGVWKVGDWVVFDLSIGQIKELSDGFASFSEGFFETSGMLADRFRPLTLRNKRIVETFDTYYSRLREIDGEGGFNYPDISRYFAQLTLSAIDADDDSAKIFYDKGAAFAFEARSYPSVIDGVRLFRPKR